MATEHEILSRIKDEEIEWIDLRFTDPKGKWHHLTMAAGLIDDDQLNDGFMFDGSSIAGWKAINEGDMILKPDLDAVYVIRSARLRCWSCSATSSNPRLASFTAATRARPRPAPRPISRRPASATPCSSGRRPSSSCSTTSASRTAMPQRLQGRRHRAADQHHARI